MKKAAFLIIISLFFSCAETHASDLLDRALSLVSASSVTAEKKDTTLTEQEQILVRPSHTSKIAVSQEKSYFVSTGGAFAIHDDDFTDFLDYGATISLGMKKRIMDKLSFMTVLDLTMLQGDWDFSRSRDVIRIEPEVYYPGHVPDNPEQVITVEDLPDENLGSGYHSEGEAIVISAELLKNVKFDTTLYLIPITFNLVYELHGAEKKINPYFGGGLGFCLARREVETRGVKEQYLEGPEYLINLDDDETVFGQLLQVFAGVEIPVKKDIKIVLAASTAVYSLKRFDPILEISHRNPDPAWYGADDMLSWSNEDPLQIGVFKDEFISSLSIGVVMPF